VSSFHLRQAFVKAFFLDLDLYFEKHKKYLRLGLILAIKNRLKSEDEAERREKIPHTCFKSLARNQRKWPGEESKA